MGWSISCFSMLKKMLRSFKESSVCRGPLFSRPVSPLRRAHPLPHLLGDLLPYSAAMCSQLTRHKKGESASPASSVSVRFCFFCWPVCLLVPVYLLVNLSFHLSSCLSFFCSSFLSPLRNVRFFSHHIYTTLLA